MSTVGPPHGYLYDDGEYTTIDAPGRASTSTQSINDRGDVLVPEPGAGYLAVATR